MEELEGNPWRTVGTRVVYENPWMRVREDRVVRPDGRPGIYGVMTPVHVATGVVALTEAGEVVLVGQYRYPTEVYSWELVEGGAKPDEAPLEAAQRELQEEAGLAAEEWGVLGGELHLSNSITAERGLLYWARGLREVPASPEGTEVLQVRRVPGAEALRWVDEGVIVDAMSVIGLLRAARAGLMG